VPGGNATLLLSALPSLARHGALAYLSMLGVQVSLAMVAKQWKQHNLRAAAAAQRSSAKNAPLKQPRSARPIIASESNAAIH